MDIITLSTDFVKSVSGQEFKFGQGFTDYEGFVKLPLIVLRTCGQSIFTLSALISLPEVRMKGCTFRGIETLGDKPGIAETAGLPLRTVKRHLKLLEREEVVINRGRRGRRTAERVVDNWIQEAYKDQPFIMFPRLLHCLDLSFSESAVMAYCCWKSGRFAGTKAEITDNFNQATAAKELGISRWHVCLAIKSLSALGLVRHSYGNVSVCI